jgi:hypothetical protein
MDASYHRNRIAAKSAADMGHGIQQAGVATPTDQHQPRLCVKHYGHVVPVGIGGPPSAVADHVIGAAALRLRAGNYLAAGPHAGEHLHRLSIELQDDTVGQICLIHSRTYLLETCVGLAKSLAEKIGMSIEGSALHLIPKARQPTGVIVVGMAEDQRLNPDLSETEHSQVVQEHRSALSCIKQHKLTVAFDHKARAMLSP